MKFQSTRNDSLLVSGTRAILDGIAKDGGLYLPEKGKLPALEISSLLNLSTMDLAEKVMGAILPDFSPEEMHGMVHRAYSGRFETDELTPLAKVGENYLLELFRGPTAAFKDVALCMLPQLVMESCRKEKIQEKIAILTATSGDTGKAALEGFHDVPGTEIIVFFPDEGVSSVQKAQMTTQIGSNVTVCAVKGNFDDAQTGVKKAFAAFQKDPIPGISFSSANSINIGRLVPQIVYYFHAYTELVNRGAIACGEPVDYVVPTGNFGDILAGYFAKKMGLPVGKLVCASNRNDVLTDFFKTGRYDRNRPFFKTVSPSMDILISSNLERMLYLMTGDASQVAAWMKELAEKGSYEISEGNRKKLAEEFAAGSCSEKETAETISKVWKENGYLLDTHTAVAWHCAEEYKKVRESNAPVVVLSTASAYKFPAAVLRALGAEPDENEFRCIEQLEELTKVPAPNPLKGIGERKVLHKDCIERETITEYIRSKVHA